MPDLQGNTGYITEVDVRLWLRDADPELNLLIDDLEFEPAEIRAAANLAVDFWNEEPPALRTAHFSVDKFPYRYNLLMATSANLLFIAANRFRRNRLPYQITGGGIDDQAKAEEYDKAGQRLWEQYKAWVKTKKREINYHQGWGLV